MSSNFLKKVTLFIIIVQGFVMRTFSQFFFTLRYEQFGVEYRPVKIPDTATFYNLEKYPNNKLIIYIVDTKGKSYFELIDKHNSVVMKGDYSNSIDTLCRYVFSKTLGNTDQKFHYKVFTIKYFQPLKSGTWSYFNSKRRLLRKEVYEFSTL